MLYSVKKSGSWGYIDKTGSIVVPCHFEMVLDFAEGFGGLFHGDKLQIIDECGSVCGACIGLREPFLTWFSNHLRKVTTVEKRTGFIDARGDWVIQPRFRRARNFGNNVAVASSFDTSGEGMIDKSGAWICEPKFERIHQFSDSASCSVGYYTDDDLGFGCILIDCAGNRVSDEFFEHGHGAAEGLVPVKRDGTWGVVSELGDLVIPFIHEGINPFSEGFAAARGSNGKYGLIDRTGHWAIHPLYDSIDSKVQDGLIAAATGDNAGRLLWGYLDCAGEWVIQPRFSEACEFLEGLASVAPFMDDSREEQSFGWINRDGHFVWEPSC